MNFLFVDARDFDDRRKRYREKPAADAKQKRLNAGQCQRNAQLNGGSLPARRGNVNGALQAVEHGANYVHTDAAAGNFGNFGGSAESRFEDQVQKIVFIGALNVLCLQQAVSYRLFANAIEIHAAAIVADFNNDLRALVIRVQINGAA